MSLIELHFSQSLDELIFLFAEQISIFDYKQGAVKCLNVCSEHFFFIFFSVGMDVGISSILFISKLEAAMLTTVSEII